MARKRRKQLEPERPYGRTLDIIEEDAARDGNEILFGPQRVKIVRTVVEYAPCPAAGPGRWQVVHRDEIVEAALDATRSGITPDMLTILRERDFSRGNLKQRLVELAELRKSIHRT
jgi:hypothetical protein